MASMSSKSFDTPDETRTPDKTTVAVVDLGGGVKAGRFTFQPGWRWSECVKPAAGTDRCQARHLGAVVSGRLHVVHEDGTEAEVGPGDAYRVEPGYDAWVVGDEPFVGYEFQSAESYAAPTS
ncbi:MAG TPA: cupin domain-containing protein [Acidimicrobiales bacterium]|nr:cupin domain-containing protein [Acidimicrobiales bacterium]